MLLFTFKDNKRVKSLCPNLTLALKKKKSLSNLVKSRLKKYSDPIMKLSLLTKDSNPDAVK